MILQGNYSLSRDIAQDLGLPEGHNTDALAPVVRDAAAGSAAGRQMFEDIVFKWAAAIYLETISGNGGWYNEAKEIKRARDFTYLACGAAHYDALTEQAPNRGLTAEMFGNGSRAESLGELLYTNGDSYLWRDLVWAASNNSHLRVLFTQAQFDFGLPKIDFSPAYARVAQAADKLGFSVGNPYVKHTAFIDVPAPHGGILVIKNYQSGILYLANMLDSPTTGPENFFAQITKLNTKNPEQAVALIRAVNILHERVSDGDPERIFLPDIDQAHAKWSNLIGKSFPTEKTATRPSFATKGQRPLLPIWVP